MYSVPGGAAIPFDSFLAEVSTGRWLAPSVRGEAMARTFNKAPLAVCAFESEKLLLGEFHVQLQGGNLSATCRGEPMDAARHQMEHEVKAITYHGLRVEQTAGGWQAEVIVDI